MGKAGMGVVSYFGSFFGTLMIALPYIPHAVSQNLAVHFEETSAKFLSSFVDVPHLSFIFSVFLQQQSMSIGLLKVCPSNQGPRQGTPRTSERLGESRVWKSPKLTSGRDKDPEWAMTETRGQRQQDRSQPAAGSLEVSRYRAQKCHPTKPPGYLGSLLDGQARQLLTHLTSQQQE